ncbi:MAG: sigma-70 family RNA polymerase sigma factor [Candidatus Hydrogenedentes bacterium]|nr:sigma-70 family RNA polymerase sigma factor [Candidatus Hydrogenedentota bacterium]
MSDRDLMLAFAADCDERKFVELVRRWDERLLRFLARAAGDAEAAKDLRQDVLVRVYQYAATFDGRSAFSTWLFRIAINRLHTWRRSGQLRQERGFELEASVPGNGSGRVRGPEEAALHDEVETAVRKELALLDANEQELLLLRFQQGLSYREIGEIVNAPETTVKSRVYSTLHRLREPLACHRESMRSLER